MTSACGGLHVESDWIDALRQGGLDSFDALYEARFAAPGSMHDRGRTGPLTLPGGRTLYLKCSAVTPLKQIAADMLRLRRCEPLSERERFALQCVGRIGITAPRPVAWGRRRRCGLPWRGVLAMTVVSGVVLNEYLASADGAERTAAMLAVGRTLRTLYESGLSWPDLRVKHVYVDDGLSVGLLDLERLDTCRNAWGRRTARQVECFCAELRDAGAEEGDLAAMLGALGGPDVLRGGSGRK